MQPQPRSARRAFPIAITSGNSTMLRIACIAAFVLLSGCASVRPVAWPWPTTNAGDTAKADNTKKVCKTEVCDADEALHAFSAASDYCARIIQKHDGSGTLFGASKVLVSTVGALSGSVISQFAQGSAAQAWSGVSGVANGVQTQMDQAFAGALDVRRKQQIAIAASDGADAYYKQKPEGTNKDDYNAKVELAMKMALACAVNGAKADGTALELLSGGRPATDVPGLVPLSSTSMKDGVLTVAYSYPNSTAERAKADAAAKAEADSACGKEGAGVHQRPEFTCFVGADCQASATFKCNLK